MISRSIFWAVSASLFAIAVVIAWVAGARAAELARLRQEAQLTAAKVEGDQRLCAVERKQAEARIADAAKRITEAEARATAARAEVVAWQSVGARAGIITWLGTHANCVGRAADGRCTRYRLPDGIVIDTDSSDTAQAR